MKVLHIFHELKFSGAEIMYVSAADIFKEHGLELFAVATGKEIGEYVGDFEQAGYKIVHLPFDKKKSISFCAKIIDYIKNESIDLVHIHSSGMRAIISYCAWKANVKSVYTFHNVFPTNWYSYLFHILQRKFIKLLFGTKFHTISDSVTLHEQNFYFNKTKQILNWYNDKKFFPANSEEKTKLRKSHGIAIDTMVLISIGGCSEIKRHSEVIKALQIIIKDKPNTLYLHLGDGKCHSEEIAFAEKLGLAENIRFLGNQTEVRKWLVMSDIYVMPSKFEGISLTTIEAMGCNIPAVLYDVPGLRDFNTKLKCSVLIKEDYKELARNILLLNEDSKLKKEITENANQFISESFNMKKNASKIIELYK